QMASNTLPEEGGHASGNRPAANKIIKRARNLSRFAKVHQWAAWAHVAAYDGEPRAVAQHAFHHFLLTEGLSLTYTEPPQRELKSRRHGHPRRNRLLPAIASAGDIVIPSR